MYFPIKKNAIVYKLLCTYSAFVIFLIWIRSGTYFYVELTNLNKERPRVLLNHILLSYDWEMKNITLKTHQIICNVKQKKKILDCIKIIN